MIRCQSPITQTQRQQPGEKSELISYSVGLVGAPSIFLLRRGDMVREEANFSSINLDKIALVKFMLGDDF